MKGGHGHHLETSAHPPDQDVLGHLKHVKEAFDLGLSGVDGEAVS